MGETSVPRRSCSALAALGFLSSVALAQNPPGFTTYQGTGQSPLSNPFASGLVGNNDPTGYSSVSCTGGSPAVIIFAGQSNATNAVDSAYSVTQANNRQLNVLDGSCYSSKGTLLGVTGSGSNVAARIGDLLISGGSYTNVVLVPMAIGSTSVANWANSTQTPYLYNAIAVVARRLAAQSLTATHVVWMQGETDTQLGTSQANYTASLNVVIGGFRSAGISAPFIVQKETWIGSTTSATVRAAQSAASGTNVFVGADLDTLDDTNRYDTTHFNATGAAAAAALIKAQIILH